MANYLYTTKESNFKPYSFDEMIRPFTLYKDEYEKQEKVINDLSSEANKVAAMANEQTDPEAYKMYQNYANDLKAQADALSSGLTAQIRQNIQGLYRRYNSEITPIENAYNIRMGLAKEQRDARNRDQSLLFDVDAQDMTLDQIIKNPNQQYKSFSMEDIRKNVFQEAQTLSKELLTNPEMGRIMGGQYAQIKMQNGFKNEDVTKAIQQFVTGEDLNANPALMNILNKNFEQFKDLSDDKKTVAMQYIAPALYAAVGDNDFKYLQDQRWQPDGSNSGGTTPSKFQVRENPLYTAYSTEYQNELKETEELLTDSLNSITTNNEEGLNILDYWINQIKNSESSNLSEDERKLVESTVRNLNEYTKQIFRKLEGKTREEQANILRQTLANGFDESLFGDIFAHPSWDFAISSNDIENLKSDLQSTFKPGEEYSSELKEFDIVNENGRLGLKQSKEDGLTQNDIENVQHANLVLPAMSDDSNLVPLLKLTIKDDKDKFRTVIVKLPKTDKNTYALLTDDLRQIQRFRTLAKQAKESGDIETLARINAASDARTQAMYENASRLFKRINIQDTKA